MLTEKEKALIKIELYKAYQELPSHCKPNSRFVLAVQQGLERAQRKIEEEEIKKNRKE